MKRKNVYNAGLVTPEKWELVCKENKALLKNFLGYLKAVDKSPQTILQYEAQLKIVFVWISENCDNKNFVDMKKREWVNFMSYLTSDLGVSSNRIASIKSAISSLSNYIELILDEEYPLFKNIIKNIPTPKKSFIRQVEIPTEEEIFQAMDTLVDMGKVQIACFLAVLFASGCRKAEVIQMRVDDFTPDRLVLHGMFYQTGEKRTKGAGKQGKVLKKNVIKSIVDKYLDLWLKKREELGITNEYLFVTQENGVYVQAKIATANSWGDKIRQVIGKEFPLHQIRHSWTDHLLRAGFPAEVVQKLQGWSDVGMVQYYSQIDDTEKLEEFFDNLETKI